VTAQTLSVFTKQPVSSWLFPRKSHRSRLYLLEVEMLYHPCWVPAERRHAMGRDVVPSEALF